MLRVPLPRAGTACAARAIAVDREPFLQAAIACKPPAIATGGHHRAGPA